MLFFRDEEQVSAWCAAHDVPRRPVATLEQLWNLAVAWYGNRLDPEPPPRTPEEVRRIFAAVGLVGSFWDPESRDHNGL